MPDGSAKGKSVRAVERAIDILECFLPENPWMSVLEIQRKVPLSRPTLYRLLQTLIAKGLVRAEGDPQRFALDFGIGRLAHSWVAGIDVVALARPILASSTGGIPELVQHDEHAYLVPPGDPTALAQGLMKLTLDQEYARSLGQNARQRIQKKFNLANQTSTLEDIYTELLYP